MTHLQHGTNRMVLDELLGIQPAQLADDISHMVCSAASTNNSRSKVDDLLYAVSLGSIARSVNGYTIEPFSGVEIHMEMDMDWKWMEMGRNL